jgi:2-phospho-L-lactate guanylyltransferase
MSDTISGAISDTISGTFALLVPVKAWDRAKTRMAEPTSLPRALTRELAGAFARDALVAAAASERVGCVYVVTDQPDFTARGVTVLPDEGAGDLNAALRAAALRARAHHPGLGIAAMCADLPCLRAEDLDSALDEPGAERWFVADAAGSGTTLLAVAPGADLDPAFGAASAARHESSGARPVTAAVASLRLDVDTTEDLRRAVRFGVGAHTADVVARHAIAC